MLDDPHGAGPAGTLEAAPTPGLVLDRDRLDRNLARLSARLRGLGVGFRPHLKTAKSREVAARLFPDGYGPITVSTLKEAEYFTEAGARDIVYAVGIAPDKIGRVMALRRRGADVSVLLDSVAQAQAVVEASREAGDPVPVLIEIDCDGHRGGLVPADPQILEVANAVAGGARLRGVLTHAGESYACRTPEALVAAAENERAAAVEAASALRQAGFACPVVSVGSTPTAHFARGLSGVTEVRAGVFMFFDLVMHGIGVCEVDDLALSVLATVVGHKPEKGWIMVDAGWMALSRDRGTARQRVDQGYGVVCALDGTPYRDLLVVDASQEHGTLGLRPGSGSPLPDLPVGTRVRILPNHACATGSQHDHYLVVRSAGTRVEGLWPRMRGW